MNKLIKILMGNKDKSDCCNIEIKEIEEVEKEACCSDDSKPCC